MIPSEKGEAKKKGRSREKQKENKERKKSGGWANASFARL